MAKGRRRDRSTSEQVRQWGKAFRTKINEYVYRSGNGKHSYRERASEKKRTTEVSPQQNNMRETKRQTAPDREM